MNKPIPLVVAAFAFTLAILGLGYVSFGFWTMLIFSSGFLGGFVLWLLSRSKATYSAIKVPYLVTLAFFIVHRIEENRLLFQERLSGLTGVPTPEVTSLSLILLLLLSVGAWLLGPFLLKRGYAFGNYLVWTFFAAMGITELAHFIFPFFTGESYGYFPGMASVVLLAPAAWWGMWRSTRKT